MQLRRSVESACASSPDALQGLSGENGVALVVVCANTAQQRTLFTECEAAAAAFGNGSFCTEATSETRQSAHLAGMGVARYEMYLRIAALDPSVTLDKCRDLPMCTLRSMLASLEDTDSDSVLSTGCIPGKGNSHGMGGWRRNQR